MQCKGTFFSNRCYNYYNEFLFYTVPISSFLFDLFLVLHPELLVSFCPLVERLGFDENFMDITKMVERRLAETPASNRFSFKGHVYNHRSESHLCVAVHLAH